MSAAVERYSWHPHVTIASMVALQLSVATAAMLLGNTVPPGTIGAEVHSSPSSVHKALSPDVFGTVALPVQRTPYDARWRRVKDLSGRGPVWVRILSDVRRASSREAKMLVVNREVNEHVRFATDSKTYGQADYWGTPQEIMNRAAGDCEDSAILKIALLKASGVPRNDLYLVILNDLAASSAHALVAVRYNSKFWILDNRTDRLLPADPSSVLRPIMSLSAEGRWVHGYRSGTKPFDTDLQTQLPHVH